MVENNKKLIALFYLVFAYGSSFGMDWLSYVVSPHDSLSDYSNNDQRINDSFKRPVVQKFLREFQPPKEILPYLIYANKKNKKKVSIETVDGKNTFFIKENSPISRVVCQRRMQNLIKKEDYRTISVTEKYLFLSYDKKRLLCAAKEVTPTSEKKVTIGLQQVREFLDVVLKTRFCDFKDGSNFMIDEDKRIVFIDTESMSFRRTGEELLVSDYLNPAIDFLLYSRYIFKTSFDLTHEAREYLENKKLEYKNNLEHTYRSLNEITRNEYDTHDLNLPKVLPLLEGKWRAKSNGALFHSF